LADANQLELAILNLAINARDAMPEGGSLTITTGTTLDGNCPIMISVSDTGTGMSADVIERAFDPFYTTKPTGKGTGLGLSQVHGIVKQSGGDVTIASEVGKGTTVTIRLRKADKAAEASPPLEQADLNTRHSEKLLVVDDDSDVREIVAGYLSELGY